MSQVNESGVDEAVITKQPSPQPNPTDSGGHQTQTTTKTKRGNALEELEKLDKVILSQEISACKREYSSFSWSVLNFSFKTRIGLLYFLSHRVFSNLWLLLNLWFCNINRYSLSTQCVLFLLVACPCCIGRGAYTVHEGNSTEDLLFEIREGKSTRLHVHTSRTLL